jgi:hypothetical protein
MSTASAQLAGELRISAEMIRTRARRLSKEADELRRIAARQLEVAERLHQELDLDERKTA